MHFTILGASGFIGSRLSERLTHMGYEVNTPSRHTKDWLKDDLGHVFYCIGLTNDYDARPFDSVEAHVCLLAELLEKGRYDRLVYLSSTRLYDSLPDAEVGEAVDLIMNTGNPRHLYDLSKALGENLCLTRSSGRACVARLSCVYSDTLSEGGFLSQLLTKCLLEKEFSINSSLGYSRDYVHVDDVVDLLKQIVMAGKGVYNVACGVNTTNAELFQELKNCAGVQVECTRQDEMHAPVVSVRKAFDEFGYRPRKLIHELPAIIDRMRLSYGN